MRTIQIYKFNELSQESKKRAIREHEWEMREKDGQEALSWALDDCSLWEPPHDEMTAALGSDYYDRNLTSNGQYGQFVFANRRNPLRVDIENRYLKFGRSLEITNGAMFLTWLGIPSELQNQVEWEIDDTGAYRSKLILTLEIESDDPQREQKMEMLQKGVCKFDVHVIKCLDRIEMGFEEYFSDENVAERLEWRDLEFTPDGNSIKVTLD
jgi:hypothetical protein